MQIIGLTGWAQSGKDSTADALADHEFQRFSFAGPLKQIAYDIDPLITADKHYAELVDEFGVDEVKVTYPEARRFLQRLGTEGLRKNVSTSFWADLATEQVNAFLTRPEGQVSPGIVFSDMRFYNEYETLRDFAQSHGFDFTSVRIERSGVSIHQRFKKDGLPTTPDDPRLHASEREMLSIPVDVVIDNEGSLDELREKAEALIK